MASLNKQIFDIIKTVPHIDENSIHGSMRGVSSDYTIASGKAALTRLLHAKYIRKDLNKRFVTHVNEYAPLPPYTKKKKKKVRGTAHTPPPALTSKNVTKAEAKSFFTKLRELFT